MKRIREEEGVAMLTAVLLLFVLMGLGAALMVTAAGQQHSAYNQQSSESAYSLAEAALNAQVFALSQRWPTKADASSTTGPNYGYPTSCNAASNGNSFCPTAADLSSSYPSGGNCPAGTRNDAWSSSSSVSNGWTTYVRDAGASGSSTQSLFSSSTEQGMSPFDSSGSGALWVRAVGILNCHIAVVVTKVSEQIVHVSFPDYVINANSFNTGNNSPNKDIINTEDTSGNTSPISLRCTGSSNGNGSQPPNSTCAGAVTGQIQPSANYVNPPSASPTLSTSQLTEVKNLAVTYNTYYGSGNCSWFNNPTPATVVYVTGDCSNSQLSAVNVGYNSTTGTCDSYTFLVVATGTVTLTGNTDFCGVIYAPNQGGATGDVVTVKGNATILGGLNVDGAASLSLGDSGNGTTCTDTSKNNKCGDLEFSMAAFLNLDGFAGADPTPNSFRQLPDNQ